MSAEWVGPATVLAAAVGGAGLLLACVVAVKALRKDAGTIEIRLGPLRFRWVRR